MSQLLNDPYMVLGLFFVCCALAIGTLLSSMKQGGTRGGIILALLFAGIAAYLAPEAFSLMSGPPEQ